MGNCRRMKFLQYFLYNGCIVGLLIASHLLQVASFGAIIVGIYYGFVLSVLFLSVIFASWSESYLKRLVPTYKNFGFWKIPIELSIIALTIYLGFPKIAVCMVFEFFAWMYILATVNRYISRKRKGR